MGIFPIDLLFAKLLCNYFIDDKRAASFHIMPRLPYKWAWKQVQEEDQQIGNISRLLEFQSDLRFFNSANNTRYYYELWRKSRILQN